MSSVEYLSKDILEESFLRSVAPYHFFQKLLGSCRVDARNRFVTVPTLMQRLYTTMCITALVALYVKTFMNLYSQYYNNYRNIFYLISTMLTIQLTIFICNLFHVRFLNNKGNMELFVKMQEIERLMKIDKDSTLNILQFRIHLFSVICLVSVALGYFCLSFASNISMTIYLSSFIYCEAPFSLEISHCSNIILYFGLRIRYVNAIVSNHIHGINRSSSKPLLTYPSLNYLKHAAMKIHDFKNSPTDIYIREIMRGFDDYKYLYRFQIAMFCAKLLFNVLLGFEYILLAIKYNVLDRIQLALFASIISIDILAALFLCLRCELFFKWTKDTKLMSISVMSMYTDGPLREKAKRMYDIIDEMPPTFSVYDMWQMNARFMLSVFNVVTSFIVTLLQFAFL